MGRAGVRTGRHAPRQVRRRRPDRRGIRFGPAFSQHDACPACGAVYSQLRTGMTYSEVRSEFWVFDDDDRTRWRNKRRGTVLGRWHQIKLALWQLHVEHCTPPDDEPVPF